MLKCILFDRDGTLGVLNDERFPQTFRPFCDIKSVFVQLKSRGLFVGIISNQSSIARGTGRNYDFAKEFEDYGVDVWEICPHDNADNCDCRKPKSGLLLQAVERLGISPCECLVVGDRISDVLCAVNVGAKAAIVLTGKGEFEIDQAKEICNDLIVLKRFDEILNFI